MKQRPHHALEFGEDDEGRLDIWQRLGRVLFAVFLVVLMGGALSMFWPQIDRHRELDAQLTRLTVERDEALVERDMLASRLEWLRTDANYLETIARDRLDLYREGEVVIRIDRGSEEAGDSP
ncbi:MAG: septum formation initiator family protein [Verrucomicrobiota bacterium]